VSESSGAGPAIRIQLGGYGSSHLPQALIASTSWRPDETWTRPYVRTVPRMFEYIRAGRGEGLELLHDIHERVPPMDATPLVKRLEAYRPFFIEDPSPPRTSPSRRQQIATIAMGELFNSPHEWTPLITEHLIDFIRVHISQAGGLSRAMKIARLGEWFNVRTAWHGPSNVSPVGHAVNAHIDLAVWNFGIQESVQFGAETQEVFSGCPRIEKGYMYVNEARARSRHQRKSRRNFPSPDHASWWKQIRRRDGTSVRP
jgi:mannonate dehydratase